MSKILDKLNPTLIKFIGEQHLFFVATAMEDGHINLSPKGMDSFRVLDDNNILWLNLTGSGNETATHLRYCDRMTIMFCAFDGKPSILRLYGKAKVFHDRDEYWQTHIGLFPEIEGSRQLIAMQLDMVQISCGMAVPLMNFEAERNLLRIWGQKQGKDGLRKYWETRNKRSLDGHISGITEE